MLCLDAVKGVVKRALVVSRFKVNGYQRYTNVFDDALN